MLTFKRNPYWMFPGGRRPTAAAVQAHAAAPPPATEPAPVNVVVFADQPPPPSFVDGLWLTGAPATAALPYSLVSRRSPPLRLQRLEGGGAVLSLRGLITKHGPITSSVEAIALLRDFVADYSLQWLLIVVESAGGSVAGTSELASEVATASRAKPVGVYIEDLGQAAALWATAGARRISANALAAIGSIGTFAVVLDSSQAAEKAGIVVHVVRAGQFKGRGTPGTPITDEHLAHTQLLVDSVNEYFLRDLRAGRRLSDAQLRAVADGKVHLAARAKELRLIDAVEPLEDALRALRAMAGKVTTRKE